MGIQWVFLDIGGPVYSDEPYRRAIRTALRELGATFADEEYEAEYEACRRDQRGSFKRRLTRTFLGSDADVREVTRRASRHWQYGADDLYPDVRPALEELGRSYRLGVLANQQSTIRAALERDGLARYFDAWAVSADLGLEKPDPAIFAHALEVSGAKAEHSAMAGDRLDYDIEPARATGMRTVWILRGEAPQHPTAEQLAVPDAAITTLADLPAALARLDGRSP
ncbi:MAG TPA: HAD family hydrolase [Actinomycetota bacterium]